MTAFLLTLHVTHVYATSLARLSLNDVTGGSEVTEVAEVTPVIKDDNMAAVVDAGTVNSVSVLLISRSFHNFFTKFSGKNQMLYIMG